LPTLVEPEPELARIISALAAGYPCEQVAEEADQYGRQADYPYAAGESWVIIRETPTLAKRIADALGGTAG
jgi:hypothetical protein